MNIDDDDINEIVEEAYRRDKFDNHFDNGLIFECTYIKNSSENEEESSE